MLAIVVSHIAYTAAWEPSGEFLRALRYASFLTPEFLFVVSGFVLFLPIAAQGGLKSKRAFAVRRAARIMPAYLLSLVVTTIFVAATTHPPLSVDIAPAFGLHLIFLQHEFVVSGFGVNQVYWTLSILAIFYVLLPFVANRYVRHPIVGLALALVVVVAWRVALQEGVSFQDTSSYPRFIQFPLFAADFAAGMTAAWSYVRFSRAPGDHRLRRLALPLGLAALAAATALVYEIGRMRLNGEIFLYGEPVLLALGVPLTFAAMMVLMAFMPSWAQWPLSNPVARWIGTVSFGVFLYHALVLRLPNVLFAFTPDGSLAAFAVLSMVVVPLSLFIGWLSFKFVEEPVRSRARGFAERLASTGRGSRSRAPAVPTARADAHPGG